jgi:hypothetical protein
MRVLLVGRVRKKIAHNVQYVVKVQRAQEQVYNHIRAQLVGFLLQQDQQYALRVLPAERNVKIVKQNVKFAWQASLVLLKAQQHVSRAILGSLQMWLVV